MKRSLVLKFGGASVAQPESFAKVAAIIAEKTKIYDNLIVVVSAMGNTTNELLALAAKVHKEPPKRELDMLLTVGERISISLLAMSLNLLSVEAVSFTGSQSGIITTEDHAEARIITVRPKRIIKELEMKKVCVVAGFQGVSDLGEITTLGRGGSDTTAVALGVALNAEHVEFYKDVDGIYTADPKTHLGAIRFENLGYDDALTIVNGGAKVLHPRAVDLAKKNGIPLLVKSFVDKLSSGSTCIGCLQEKKPARPLYELD